MDKINLQDVTLVGVSSVSVNQLAVNLIYSSKQIIFGDIKILTHEYPSGLPDRIKFVKIPELKNIMDYNNFIFFDLGDYIETEFALLIHPDSLIIHPEVWDNEFLNWDYGGALWPIVENSYIADNGERVRVGNGGFSLRSRKIMQAPRKYNLELKQEQGFYNEDGNLTNYHRSKLLELGVKYMPIELAAKFSFENWVPENLNVEKFFGFHKNYPGF